MAMSMYEASAPLARQLLDAMVGVIDKAVAHCEARKIDPAVLAGARLYPDMLPLTFQISGVVNHGPLAIKRLVTGDEPRITGLQTFEDMQKALADGRAVLDAIRPADLDGAETREVLWHAPVGTSRFLGQAYWQSFSIPNLFFHAATAYGILRHNGVELGKRDFMGEVQRLS